MSEVEQHIVMIKTEQASPTEKVELFEGRCSCGWRSPVETVAAEASYHCEEHLAEQWLNARERVGLLHTELNAALTDARNGWKQQEEVSFELAAAIARITELEDAGRDYIAKISNPLSPPFERQLAVNKLAEVLGEKS